MIKGILNRKADIILEKRVNDLIFRVKGSEPKVLIIDTRYVELRLEGKSFAKNMFLFQNWIDDEITKEFPELNKLHQMEIRVSGKIIIT